MDLLEVKNDLSLRSKNGLSFLLSAIIIWTIITIIFIFPLQIKTQNIFMFVSTGLMFPLAVVASKVIKAEWRFGNNPLSDLGLYLNLAQFMYFPILFWAFAKAPHDLVLFFAIITGAHLFPYGWLYRAKAYYIMAPVISVAVVIIGWSVKQHQLWIIPLFMVAAMLILNVSLLIDYKHKRIHRLAKTQCK